MNLIVLDLEWNQSSTGTEPEVEKLPFEIIEIGAIKLNSENAMIGEFSELIKPKVYTKMHQITSKLIHLQMQELQRGEAFETVADKFLTWCGEDYRFCTWGPTDIQELQRNLRFFGMEPLENGPVPYIDAQKIYSLAYETDQRVRRSLETAVDALGIEKDIPFHRAFSDAYYTAKVVSRTMEEHPECFSYVSYDVTVPPANKEAELHLDFGTYHKYISRGFAGKEEAMHDREVLSTRCYLCGKNLKRRIPWFSTNGRYYLSLSVCEKHGPMKGKIRLQKVENEQLCVVKTTKFIGADSVKSLENRYHKAADRKDKWLKTVIRE